MHRIANQGHRVALEGCVVDLWAGRVERTDGGEEGLTHLEVALLRHLISRPGQPVTREELLSEVWGYGAAVRTRAVDATVKRLRRKIEVDASDPTHLRKVHGTGYAFFPRVVPDEGAPSGGRARLGDDVVRALDDASIVTLVGPPGVGASWLAAEVARRSFRRAVRVSASGVRDDAGLAIAVSRAVVGGVSDAVGSVPEALRLGDVALVCLDDVDADGPFDALVTWSEAAPGARWLVTARAPLGLRGERVIAVPPLDSDEARALLVGRLAAHGVKAPPSAVLDPLLHHLDGLPLAIELVAARIAVSSVEQVLALLEDASTGSVLPTLDDGLARLAAALPEDARRLWAAAARLGPTFDLDVAAAAIDRPPAEALASVDALARASLLDVRRGSPTRYALPTTVRRFGRARLAADPLAPRRVLALRLERLDGVWPGERRVRPYLLSVRDDLAACVDAADPTERVRVGLWIDDADRVAVPLDAREARLRTLHGLPGTPADHVELTLRLGECAGRRGDHVVAEALFREAARVDVPSLRVRALVGLGLTDRFLGAHDAAVAALDEAVAIAQSLGDPEPYGVAVWCRATLAGELGDVEGLVSRLLIAITHGSPRARGLALESLSNHTRRYGRSERAEQQIRQAITTLRDAGDLVDAAHAECNLGTLQLDAGSADLASATFHRAFSVASAAGAALVAGLAASGAALAAALASPRELDPWVRRAFELPATPLAEGLREAAAAIAAARAGDRAACFASLARAVSAVGPEEAPAARVLRGWAEAELLGGDAAPPDDDPLAVAVADVLAGREPASAARRAFDDPGRLGASLLDVAGALRGARTASDVVSSNW